MSSSKKSPSMKKISPIETMMRTTRWTPIPKMKLMIRCMRLEATQMKYTRRLAIRRMNLWLLLEGKMIAGFCGGLAPKIRCSSSEVMEIQFLPYSLLSTENCSQVEVLMGLLKYGM